MVTFDYCITGRPYLDVTEYLNGRQEHDDATYQFLLNEFGNHALMITGASLNDGEVNQCVDRNKGGKASFQVRLNFIEREQVVGLQFEEHFPTDYVKEGEPAGLQHKSNGRLFEPSTKALDGYSLLLAELQRAFGIEQIDWVVVYEASDCFGKSFMSMLIEKKTCLNFILLFI